ncbi:hypothetical protein BVRB_9g204340 [Beta vulgaris subsp. vulgaris]|nr:hypothetical protein BVRB_9g204340 [Beta vulgaris subsp. vulgaris]
MVVNIYEVWKSFKKMITRSRLRRKSSADDQAPTEQEVVVMGHIVCCDDLFNRIVKRNVKEADACNSLLTAHIAAQKHFCYRPNIFI